MPIFDDPEAAMAGGYPARPFSLKHRLADDGLFSLEALLALVTRLPPESIEYNAGDIRVDQDPDKTPMTGLSIGETIRRIEECNSWVVIRHVERDAQYNNVLENCLAEIAPSAANSTGPMHRKQGFIFISSPNATTPLHFDPEHNILMHLRGAKRIIVCPPDKAGVPDIQHELYHAGEAHRNLRLSPELERHAETFDLGPGDALYIPVKAPHWVRTGEGPCISFSVTWRSRASDAEARLRLANHQIRQWGGAPPAPGAAPARDAAVVFAQRALSKFAPFRKGGA